jgi:hypothetical protein
MRRNANHAFGRAARRGFAGALAAVGLLAGGVSAQDEAPKTVTRGAQGYSIDASETNVVQILSEVGQQAGFTVEAPDQFNSPLTVSMQDVPLDQLLRRVLRNENYIIVYRGGEQKTSISAEAIDKIFLLSQAAEGAAPPAGGGSPLAGPGGAPAQPGGRGTAPPAPAPATAGGEDEGGDIATRAARARARAEARRAALGENVAPGAPGGPVPPVPGTMPNAARMVQAPDDFTPPPLDDSAPHGDVPHTDVPPTDEGAEEDY